MGRYSFDLKEHHHALDGKPLVGTTTVLSIISKPLTWWAAGMALTELGWVKSLEKDRKATEEEKKHREIERLLRANDALQVLSKITAEEYVKLLDKAYRAHNTKKEKAADEGVDLHALLEEYIKANMEGRTVTLRPEISSFASWSRANVQRFLFSEIHCYSEILWTGGIADFGYVDKAGKKVLGDFKSSAEAYWSHAVQVGGYDLQLSENGGFDDKGNKILLPTPFDYHAIFAARAGLDKPFFNHNPVPAKKAFAYAVNLYREQNLFGGFER